MAGRVHPRRQVRLGELEKPFTDSLVQIYSGGRDVPIPPGGRRGRREVRTSADLAGSLTKHPAHARRRLLYVACTRAQTLLYLTHANSRKFAGEARKRDLSEFVSIALKDDQVTCRVQKYSSRVAC